MFKISKIKQKLLILRKVIQATEVVPKELLKEEIFVKYFRKLFKLIMQKIVLIPKKLNAKLSKWRRKKVKIRIQYFLDII